MGWKSVVSCPIVIALLCTACHFVIPTISAANDSETKPVLAVYDFSCKEVPEVLAKALTERIHDELFHRDFYRIVARSDMRNVFKEQGFQLTGACDDANCLMEVGRVLGAELIVGGTISLVDSYYTVSIRIVEVETGEIIKSASSTKYFTAEKLLNKGVIELTDDLLGEKRKYRLLTNPYFWGGIAVTVAAGTAVYLKSVEDNSSAESPTGTVEVIISLP